MKHITKKLLAVLLILATVAVFPWTPSDRLPQASAATVIDDLQDAVTLHCWNWSFEAIEQKMATIAGMGYNAIQVSPIQQAKQETSGFQFYDWWVYYQPASFAIDDTGTSALGNKAQFKSMCQTAHKYGIKVIVDVVANHMGNGATENTLSSTIIADLRNDSSCWHNIKTNITNYNDRHNITQYCMDGVPDLNTASKKVQNYVLSFLKECVDAGADGFRFDGAKHIETPDDSSSFASDFWPTVIDGIKAYAPDIYLYGEVLYSPDDAGKLSIDAYTKYMSVTDNTWGASVRDGVVGSKNAAAFSYQYHKSTTADKLVIWAESHDDWADAHDDCDNSCAGCDPTPIATVNKAWALVAARADAMALYLARPGDITQQLGTAASGTGWDSKEVAYANRFHAKFVGQSEYLGSESGVAYVIRGNSGIVLVNCSGNAKSVSISNPQSAMKDGTYTDQLTGNQFTVSGGKISGQIGSSGIAVVYAESPCAHKSHSTDGLCTACGIPVNHSYNISGVCPCGKVGTKTVYFRNTAGWTAVNIYAWDSKETQYAGKWPGTKMTHVSGDLYSYVLPPNVENVIFNNGAAQTRDLMVPEEEDLYDYQSGAWTVYNSGSGTGTSGSTGSTLPGSGSSQPSTGATSGTGQPSTGATSGVSQPGASEPVSTQPVASGPDTPADPSSPEASQPSGSEGTPGEPSPTLSGDATGTSDSSQEEPAGQNSDSTLLWVILAAAVVLAAAAVAVALILRGSKAKDKT